MKRVEDSEVRDVADHVSSMVSEWATAKAAALEAQIAEAKAAADAAAEAARNTPEGYIKEVNKVLEGRGINMSILTPSELNQVDTYLKQRSAQYFFSDGPTGTPTNAPDPAVATPAPAQDSTPTA